MSKQGKLRETIKLKITITKATSSILFSYSKRFGRDCLNQMDSIAFQLLLVIPIF